jgi:uncharacterized protein YegJ (DUF2314 family)
VIFSLPSFSEEPRFNQISKNDLEINNAYSSASKTINIFVEKVSSGNDSTYMVKLRFLDPILSKESGVDKFMYLWLIDIVYHPKDKILSGVFFEVPSSLKAWHKVGERLGFELDDVFDWMINDNGKVEGGFTIRVARNRLSTDKEKIEYDEYIGISSYEPIPKL